MLGLILADIASHPKTKRVPNFELLILATVESIKWVDASIVGLFQAISLLPGISRSGSIFSPPEGNYPVLAGIVLQWEFAKFSFGSSFMKSIGLYTEGGLVFIPSEASSSLDEFIRPTIAFGLRLGLF